MSFAPHAEAGHAALICGGIDDDAGSVASSCRRTKSIAALVSAVVSPSRVKMEALDGMNSKGLKKQRHVLCAHMSEWYAAGLFLIYAVLLFWHHTMPALADFHDWAYEGVLLRDRILGASDHAHILKHYPVPNSAVTIGVALFSLIFPWKIAAKLWLCVVFAISFFSSKHMMHTCRANSSIWLIVPSAVFLNMNLWYGFVNFQLGICWAILVASFLLRDERREWVFGALLVVAFFTHMIPFAFAALLVLIYALHSRRIRLLWQFLPVSVLSVWYIAGRFLVEHNADGKSGMVSSVHTFSLMFWAFKADSWLKSFGFVNPGTLDKSLGIKLLGVDTFVSLFLVNVVLCTAMGWMLIETAISSYRERRRDRFIWTAAIMFTVGYLISPASALGISDPGSRLLQTVLAVVLFLSLADGDRHRNILRLSAVCSLLLAASSLFLFKSTVFSPDREGSSVRFLPHKMVVFAHVDVHGREYLYQAIDQRDMRFSVWPTGMFLNSPEAKGAPATEGSASPPPGTI